MTLRKHDGTAGFSLIEVLVAITILGLVVVPIGSSLVLSFRLNAQSDKTLQAQLAVSSAVETLMAEGYDPDHDYDTEFPAVTIDVDDSDPPTYQITVTSKTEDHVFVETYVRPAKGGDT